MTGVEVPGGHAEYMPAYADATILLPKGSPTSRPRRSSAPVTRCGAGFAGPIRSRTSAWPWSASAGRGISPCSTPRRRGSNGIRGEAAARLGDLILRRIKVVGSQQNGREFLYEALDYVASGKVKIMAETYPLADVNKAYDRVAEGKVRFRAVIVNAGR